MTKVRMFLCKIGLHKWSRKTFIDYGPTSNVKTWRRYCKICGKRQTWVQAKGDKKWFRGISKMSHYLIEFRFHGYARRHLKRLILKVARRFHVKGVTRKRPVPHISLAGPFETRDIERVIRDVESVAKNYNLVNFKLKGLDYFNKPNGKVIYADIEPSKELEELRWNLAKRLMKYAELKEWDKKKNSSFHATIAFKGLLAISCG